MIQIPEGYGYILAAATSTALLHTYHLVLTSSARKASGIKYPTPYATEEQAAKDPKAYKFNVAQRAHANYTENLTPFLALLGVAGLAYPTQTAYLGWGWVISRFAYAFGYTTYGPPGRGIGFLGSELATLGLLYYAGLTSWNAIKA
ncbi:MAPEG family protein [Xylariaceae sp. FL0255]|nr:MAPEG family protein [Xylariaceae sp. FL0255]